MGMFDDAQAKMKKVADDAKDKAEEVKDDLRDKAHHLELKAYEKNGEPKNNTDAANHNQDTKGRDL